MGESIGVRKLLNKYKDLCKDPLVYVIAKPDESNTLLWDVALYGSPDTPYEKGLYYVNLIFPIDYPYKPPLISMLTPSGRYKPNERICLTISDYHPETWKPIYGPKEIILGLQSHMADETDGGLGSIKDTPVNKQYYAKKSWRWNLGNPRFCTAFPELIEECRKKSI